MSGDNRQNDEPEELPPGVLTPEELSSDELRQLDETTQVVPLDEPEAGDGHPGAADTDSPEQGPADGRRGPETGAGEAVGDSHAVETETGPNGSAFAATVHLQTPDGTTAFETHSDDIDAFFDDLMLQFLQTVAPDRDPETALAVLLRASSLEGPANP
jgi:hypothetical protein